MPSGVALDDRTAALHADTADVLAEPHQPLNDPKGLDRDEKEYGLQTDVLETVGPTDVNQPA
jgi:hypothetical protein